MKHEKKFSQHEQQQVSESQTQASQTIREFALPEDVLRFDAKQTAVPANVAQRLSRSLQRLPPPSRPWWRFWR
jgi:predicted nucleic acid-binding protein